MATPAGVERRDRVATCSVGRVHVHVHVRAGLRPAVPEAGQ